MNISARRSLAGLTLSFIMLVFTVSVNAQMADNSILKEFKWRNIGPANMSGRTTDVEAVESNPKIIYAGTATSGIWKTINAGITWKPIFDNEAVVSVGDLAVYQKNPDIVYVGTGESNGRNSSPWGGGIYKTEDGGKTWTHLGLKNTHHIGRVIVDKDNPNTVFVAAVGRLWNTSEERGVYKTTNGGRTWNKILYIDEKTGVTDLAVDPGNKNIMYAAAYERMRDAFSGGDPVKRWGPGSGIYVTTNGGKDWTKITKGLPTAEMGRIGLDVPRTKPGTIYALIETENTPSFGQGANKPGEKPDVNRGGIFKSTDHGKSWKIINNYNSRPFYYSQIRVDPNDEDVIWMGGTALGRSKDGGKTVVSGDRISGPTHIDYHAVWIDPNDSDHVLLGSDGGISVTFDDGENWDMFVQMPMAQFYAISADMRKPYFVYGGLQDNGTWGGPSRTRSRWGIRNEDWYMLSWGDGFYAQIDPTDYKIVYTESQNGNIRRNNLATGQSRGLRPRGTNNIINYRDYYGSPRGDSQSGGRGGNRGPLRFDWNSPILISQHNHNTIYFGGNHLFRSLNRGDKWTIISPDLTSTPDKRSAIVSIDESPINPSVLWAGTNDGNVWVTRDGGANWAKLNNNITGAPQKYWVKRVEVSNHEEGRAYVVFDGHRNDDINPYVYATEDFGETWTNITNNLPEGSVYVVREDYENPNLLFAGTSYAVHVSLDRGKTWTRFMNNMPTVPVHDLYIHPRDGDLIAGTHGRGAWIADDITPLREYTEDVMNMESFVFDIRPETLWKTPTGQYPYQSDKMFKGNNPENGPFVSYYLKSEPSNAEIMITDISGERVFTAKLEKTTGINKFKWSGRFNPNERQISGFVRNSMRIIDQMIENASGDQKKMVENLKSDFENAGEDLDALRGLQDRFFQAVREVGTGGRRFFGGGLQGAAAAPGQYLVTVTIDGKTFKKTLLLEEDKADYIVR